MSKASRALTPVLSAFERAKRLIEAEKAAKLTQAEKDANLQQWMSSGKIRTDEGDPLRLYHVTPKDFDQFKAGGDDPTISGAATWLTDRADYQPAMHNVGTRQEGVFKEGTNVMPVYSNASRPLLIDDPEMQQWANDVFAGGKSELPYQMSPSTAKAIKEAGYDYVHYADPYKSNEPHEYIMLEPERQLKSAIGNRGTYDPNEPSLTKAAGGLVDSAPEEAIKNTITDPQAFRMLDMDLANLALMNQPQRMAGGGAMKKIVKKVMPQAEQTNATAMRQFKQLVEREAPEQYKPITDAMSQSAQTGLEHSVIGNTNSGGESFVTSGTKDSVVPNVFNKDVAIYSPNSPNIIDFHTHPAKFTTFGVDPSIKDLEFYSEQYRKMAKDRELRTLIAIPPERVEFLSRQIARPRTAYNFFATNDPSVLSQKTADDMRYELQRAGGLGAFDEVRSDPRFKEYFENTGGNMGDTLGDATSLLLQRYRALQGKGRHELQLSGAPIDSGGEVTDSAMFDALLNPAMQVLEGKKFAQGGQVQRFDEGGEVSQSELDRMKFEIAQQQNPSSPVMQATPRSAIQDFIGTAGGYMDKAGKFVSEAIAPTAEKHPVKHFLANMLLADSLKSAGTALQDYTGTAREADEDNPVRGLISKDFRNLNTSTEPLLDPRALDVAGFATPVVKGVTKLAGAGAKAITPFAKSKAEMAAELYGRGQMPGMVAPNAYMAEPSVPKPAKALAPANEQGFYSPTEAAALNLQRKSGSGQALLNDILKGENVRSDEVSAMGLDTFLKDKKNVTTAEVQDYIAQNKLGLGEARYGGKIKEDPVGIAKRKEIFDSYEPAIQKAYKDLDSTYDRVEQAEIYKRLDDIQNERDEMADAAYKLPESKDSKFDKYTLPGGENYREVVLTLPDPKDALMDQIKALGITKSADRISINDILQRGGSDELAESWKKAMTDPYRSSHFDEPNPLAHLRMSDRVTDGKKTLLVDEVQSDWHQAGREQGYKLPPEATASMDSEYRALVHKNADAVAQGLTPDSKDVARAKMLEEQLIQSDSSKIPNAPYKEDWYQLALRRAVKEAIDGGYDRVALPTGKRVIDRFSDQLRQNVDEINFSTDYRNKDKIIVAASKQGQIMFEGNIVDGKFIDGPAQGKTVNEVLGKSIAKQIYSHDPSSGLGVIKGDDLSIGGEGMKKYYDEIYPGYLNNFGKKYGATVGKTTVDVEGAAEPLHYMDITPAMRKEFSTGIHMKKGGKVSFAPNVDAMRHELNKRQ